MRFSIATIKAVRGCGVPMTLLEARDVVRAAAPLYRNGRLTWSALQAACRVLYAGYDDYRPESKAFLQREARHVLRAGEAASA
jgi:hypothetical protein